MLSTDIDAVALHFVQIVLTKCFEGEPLRVFDLNAKLLEGLQHYNIPDTPSNRVTILAEVRRLAMCAEVSSKAILEQLK